MNIKVVLETHSTTEDNERGIATGWLPGELSDAGRHQANELGLRRRDDGLEAIFTSDLRRALQTVEIAFGGADGEPSRIPVFHDWRLRECNYGRLNGSPRAEVHQNRAAHLDEPYPGGESWREAVERIGAVFVDLARKPPGRRILLVGHMSAILACKHFLGGTPLEDLVASDGEWQPGWEFELQAGVLRGTTT